MSKQKKGSEFERRICKKISLWWSDDYHDDLFWRSSTSGARATTRKKSGLKTRGHYGDIAATCPDGERLIDCITFELKRGYSSATFQDMIDKPIHGASQVWEDWINQAQEAWANAGSYAWAIVTQRDRRRELICIPKYFYTDLKKLGLFSDETEPGVVIRMPNGEGNPILVFITTMDYFLEEVEPCHIKQLNI